MGGGGREGWGGGGEGEGGVESRREGRSEEWEESEGCEI